MVSILQRVQGELEALLASTCPPGTIEQAQRLLADAFRAGRQDGIVEAIQRVADEDDRTRLRHELLPPIRGEKKPPRIPW